jgi:pyrroloquinoline quinone biosynthesis protein D
MNLLRISDKPALSDRVRLQVDPVTGGTVLLYPEGILELNETAQEIVQRCNGTSTVAEIVAELVHEYDVPQEELALDVIESLSGLMQRGMIVIRP